jgi:hypothetical protein
MHLVTRMRLLQLTTCVLSQEAETPGDTARGTDPLAAQVLMEEKQVTSLLREMHDEAGACGPSGSTG